MAKANKTTTAPPVVQPVPATQPKDEADTFRFFYEKVAPWVNHGTVYGFEMHEEMVKPTILEYECAIYALAPVTTGTVLGITGGRRGHLFYFHPSFYVVDLGLISEKPVTGGIIVRTHDDVVVGGWRGESGGLFRHDARHEMGTGQEDFYSRRSPIISIPMPDRKDGVLALVHSAAERKTYGLTTSGKIISLSDDARRTKMEARVETQVPAMLAPALALLPDGSLLGGCEEGQLWQWHPGQPAVEKLGIYTPVEKGKRYLAAVQSLLLSDNGLIYGGTATDGFIFSYEPNRRKLINLGKPNRQSFIRALTEGHEGLIYGIVEEPKGLAHVFTYDPQHGGFEDLGLLSTFIPAQWTPHSLGAICTGIHGEIYLGESDTLSHLFVYHPPVVRQVRKELQ